MQMLKTVEVEQETEPEGYREVVSQMRELKGRFFSDWLSKNVDSGASSIPVDDDTVSAQQISQAVEAFRKKRRSKGRPRRRVTTTAMGDAVQEFKDSEGEVQKSINEYMVN